MKTAIVTDGRYRMSLAAIRALGEGGYRVVVTQTRQESPEPPASFSSRFAEKRQWIAGSCKEEKYGDRLLALLAQYERPVLFCVGADTLNMVSRRREEFAAVCDFLIAPPETLDALNDKEQVHARCLELDIPVPRQYVRTPETFPVVIKPHCGEKFGLKARDRYTIARGPEDFLEKYQGMQRYDAAPIVQELVTGAGEGVNLLLGKDSELLCAYCHRRVREYPVTGGPSTCCVSFYNERMIQQAYALLRSFGFVGMAMVEFKGGKVLEVNPRVWGSFPMTQVCGSPFTLRYAQAAGGEVIPYTAGDYKLGVKMRFLLSDGMATLGYLRRGQLGKALGGVADFFTTPDALRRKDDKAPYQAYLRSAVRNR